jgi:tyrosyl-tRNA synthetase
MDDDRTLIAGVERIYPTDRAFLERLANGPPLRLYLGIDPTNPILHLGHTVPLRILQRFQERGHTAIVLIGDFTATVGDPSGRDSQRSVLARESIEANVLALKDQLFKVLDPTQTELRFNSEWYDDADRLGRLRQFMALSHSFTAAQLWERDLFQARQQRQQPVSLTEFLYPVLQAYDSVALDVDAEVGGTDQTFNMLAGRTLLRQQRDTEKFVLTVPLIAGTDGRKMSKSYVNTIGVTEPPGEMYGKLMSIRDEQILPYMTHLTDRFQRDAHREEYGQMIRERPRDAKALLAREIVALYHSSQAATEAERAFNATFRNHEVPAEVEAVRFDTVDDLASLMLQLGVAGSRSAASRVVEQGGVTVDGDRIHNPNQPVPHRPNRPFVVKVGKRRFFRVTITE